MGIIVKDITMKSVLTIVSTKDRLLKLDESPFFISKIANKKTEVILRTNTSEVAVFNNGTEKKSFEG